MPSILETLREAQRRQGLSAPRPDDETAVVPTVGATPVCKPQSRQDAKPESQDDVDPDPEDFFPKLPGHPDYVEPKQEVSQKLGTPHAGKGYLKIFPPTVRTIAELTPEWKAANWTGPSPWCRIEGEPEHPDFEANLVAFENAP